MSKKYTPKRPRDLSQRAKRIVAISTGEESDEPEPVNENARKGGVARAKKLSPERRSEIARAAARARWNKDE